MTNEQMTHINSDLNEIHERILFIQSRLTNPHSFTHGMIKREIQQIANTANDLLTFANRNFT